MQKVGSLFLEVIQEHERKWGTEQYPNRSTLAALLSAPIVIGWVEPLISKFPTAASAVSAPARMQLKAYQDADQVNAELYNMLMLSSKVAVPFRKIAQVYVKQQPVTVEGLRLIFAAKK